MTKREKDWVIARLVEMEGAVRRNHALGMKARARQYEVQAYELKNVLRAMELMEKGFTVPHEVYWHY